MKYLAILRDSFRESLDSKILYVTGILSGLVILFIASISIRPLTMVEELQARARLLEFILGSRQPGMKVEVQNFRQTNDASEPWNGDYQFTFVLTTPLPAGVSKDDRLARGMRSLIDQSATRDLGIFVEGFFWRLNIRELKSEPGAINEFRLKVVSKGTKVTRKEDWSHEPVLFFGAWPLSWMIMSPVQMLFLIENYLVDSILGWIIILLSIIATAFFVPNMLRKGSVDLLLSKPISRVRLLVFKYLGGLTFVFLNASVIIVSVWIIVSLRSGIWAWGFLLTIPLLTFFFAILYAVSVLIGVWTRSTVVSILLTCVAWFVIWLIGFLYGKTFPEPIPADSVSARMEAAREGSSGETQGWGLPSWMADGVKVLHRSLPRTRDLSKLTAQLLNRDLLSEAERRAEGLEGPAQTTWAECVGVSCAWIVLLLGVSSWLFVRRDF
jgi:ABC-type transport system involved in multi-copper enzyme maturation permease subunit